MFPPAPWPTNWDVLGSASTKALCCCLSKTSWGFDLQIISTLQSVTMYEPLNSRNFEADFLSLQRYQKSRIFLTHPHLAQHAVPPWQRKDLSFQLMARGAAEAPKLLELPMWHKKHFPHISRVWNRFVDWNLHLKKKLKKNVYYLKSVGMLGSRSQKNSDIYALIFIIHGSFLNWKAHCNPRNAKWRKNQLTLPL